MNKLITALFTLFVFININIQPYNIFHFGVVALDKTINNEFMQKYIDKYLAIGSGMLYVPT
jgi:hypothetical protein